MRMWFQVDVQRSTARFKPCLFERKDLGVFEPLVSVSSGADDVACRVRNNGAHIGIRRSQANSGTRQLKSTMKMPIICGICKHSGSEPEANAELKLECVTRP